ncbi:MAG: hypothetical protein ACRDSZ_07070 [Pseudonocardiaceae bacterium]
MATHPEAVAFAQAWPIATSTSWRSVEQTPRAVQALTDVNNMLFKILATPDR